MASGDERPARHEGPARYVQVAVGSTHGCALTDGGRVHGQVGDPGRPSAVAVPRRIEGLPPVVEVALGAEHACARAANGELWCWGSDIEGQLGLGTPGFITVPTKLAPVTNRPRTK
jgi:alpha-tubulin suppressor-like RCC1 family protein